MTRPAGPSRWSESNCRWENDAQPFFSGEVEPCINGLTVALGVYFAQPVDGIVARLIGEQLDDGGWNCWTEYGAVVSSCATTINVLEGLLAYERADGGSPETVAARLRGEEYLLERRLFRRKSTGETIDDSWLQFSFPPRWHYDVLRALDYFHIAGGPPTRGWLRRSRCCDPSSSPTGRGRWRTHIPARSTSHSKTATAVPAAGTLCAR